MESQRHLFSLPRDLCYLNAAYMTPQPDAVRQAGHRGVDFRADAWTITETDFFSDVEVLRENFARLLGASSNDVAIVPSASYGVSTAARNISLQSGKKVLLLEGQFPSQVYPWTRLCAEQGGEIHFVPAPNNFDWTSAILATIEKLGETISVASLPNYHWSSGSYIDLPNVGNALKGVGATLVLDLTQSLGACPFDLESARPDYIVAAGYKWLFCPYGISFLYVSQQHQGGTPLEENWINRIGSESFSAIANYREVYQPGARRFDVGERASFGLVPGAIEAIQQISSWGVENIAARLEQYNARLMEMLQGYGFDVPDRRFRGPHFLGARIPDGLGHHLSQSLRERNVSVSIRGEFIRLTPHVYNDDEDLERFRSALEGQSRSRGSNS